MKLSKLLIVIIIFCSVFIAASIELSVYSQSQPFKGAIDYIKLLSAGHGDALPLKNQLLFLLLTGASLGLKYLVDTNKKLKPHKF